MLSSLLLALLSPVSGPASLVPVPAPLAPAVDQAAPAPIRLWVSSSRQFREGEKARVQVETQHDGYLVVFNYDSDGRLRVVFPIDPTDDNLVRGGRRYEIRGRGDRETFIVGGAGELSKLSAVAESLIKSGKIVSLVSVLMPFSPSTTHQPKRLRLSPCFLTHNTTSASGMRFVNQPTVNQAHAQVGT